MTRPLEDLKGASMHVSSRWCSLGHLVPLVSDPGHATELCPLDVASCHVR